MDFDNDDLFAFYPLVNPVCAGRSGCRCAPRRSQYLASPASRQQRGGENRFHVVENDGGSLEAIAKKYNVGFLALLQANPGVDPYVPRAGSVLTIPLQTILPDAPRQGIVINLAELRLYYYPPGKNEVTVYPIGIGQLGAIRSRRPW